MQNLPHLRARLTAACAALLLTLAAPTSAAAQSGDNTHKLALDVLERIDIAPDGTMDTYERSDWGSSWTDADGTGCDTRNDILARDLDPDTLSVRDDCAVEYGEGLDPYSGEPMEHILGESQIDIEHVVAVGQAHRDGGADWTEQQKRDFYQDKENLLAVSASENRSKGSRDASEYMPPNQGIYCEFVGTKIYVKDKYGLTMNQQEHDVINDVLSTPECDRAAAAPAQAMTGSYNPGTAAEPGESSTPEPAEPAGETGEDEGEDEEIGIVLGLLLIAGLLTLWVLTRRRK